MTLDDLFDDTVGWFICPSEGAIVRPWMCFQDAQASRLLFYASCAVCKEADLQK